MYLPFEVPDEVADVLLHHAGWQKVAQSNPPSAETPGPPEPGLPVKELKAPRCKGHDQPMRLVPAGVSASTGKSYPEHWRCAATRGDVCGDKRLAR